MKKLVFLFMILSLNVHAANLTDTIGSQCAEILSYLDYWDYPSNFDMIKKRNSQLWALNKCLKVYKENGGDINELNKRYARASVKFYSKIGECYKQENMDRCISPYLLQLKEDVANGLEK